MNLERRTNDDLHLGRPILDLPPPVKEVRRIEFNPEESIMYRSVKDKFRELINQYFDEWDERKRLTYFLPQLTYLRQSVCTFHTWRVSLTPTE